MKRIRRAGAAVLVAAAILLSACGGLNPEEIAGRYTLTRVNGVTLHWRYWAVGGRSTPTSPGLLISRPAPR